MFFFIISSLYKSTTFELGGFMCSSSLLTTPTEQHKRFLKDNEKKVSPLFSANFVLWLPRQCC